MRKMFALVAAAALLTSVSACNTIEGVGKDVSAAGSAVAGAARDTRN